LRQGEPRLTAPVSFTPTPLLITSVTGNDAKFREENLPCQVPASGGGFVAAPALAWMTELPALPKGVRIDKRRTTPIVTFMLFIQVSSFLDKWRPPVRASYRRRAKLLRHQKVNGKARIDVPGSEIYG